MMDEICQHCGSKDLVVIFWEIEHLQNGGRWCKTTKRCTKCSLLAITYGDNAPDGRGIKESE